MKGTKPLILNALSALRKNIDRTGDPLGFKGVYWTRWAEDRKFPDKGMTLLVTARMYQMLPYITQAAELMTTARPIISRKGLGFFLDMGNRLAGESLIRLKARGAHRIKEKGTKTLQGIAAALDAAGHSLAYLYDAEPYSGILLYDLGLNDYVVHHIKGVYRLFKSRGVEEVICVDPHTTFMLKEIFPRYIGSYDLRVRHYLEVVAPEINRSGVTDRSLIPKKLVIHDSCVMTRDLGMVEEVRRVCAALKITLLEPENTKTDTACCGGPVEYAFSDLTRQISSLRMNELARIHNEILVTCPICLVNLSKYEESLGVRVWDMGEILFEHLAELSSPRIF
ncbi:MAG: (Fe-S)-binding protein [Deltaproteobacteria bacterium]|nr:(Fe-S)-binding protein [Deltaproteobacteria bacterium]